MNKKALVLVLGVFVITAVASLTSPTVTSEAPAMSPLSAQIEPGGTCGDTSVASTDAPDPTRVPPGCCTSNCTVNKDCDRICGKGNCICIASNDCCRRCTW
jgi:hypothetical protein